MNLQPRYARAKAGFLKDKAICVQNRSLFSKFLEFEEYKLKRSNGLAVLDDGCYQTLVTYIVHLRTVNRWFTNKPWKLLTRTDIRRVYDDLEEDRIRNRDGTPIRRKDTYYRKILRGKPFEMAGKAAIVKEVLSLGTHRPKTEVRFIAEPTFRSLVDVMIQPEHRLLAWLGFDIGENTSSLLKLRKRDCTRRLNPDTNDPEYLVNLRRETLKRSRRARSELTNYTETVGLLDELLPTLKDDDLLFKFGSAQAAKVLRRAVSLTAARCLPAGQPVTLKDLRSSMACDLLSKGWTTDEVNARLGHTPSSRELDRYVNFLAVNRDRPKKKLHDNRIEVLLSRIDDFRQREQLLRQRQESLTENVARLEKRLGDQNRLVFEEVQRLVDGRFRELKEAV